ncbi:MAG: hypothetical protein D6681_06085 [Calditrichaeota bacterium]|nr:MAG: hypothetical protein D6681_06085 [Calditrichota bacterium]
MNRWSFHQPARPGPYHPVTGEGRRPVFSFWSLPLWNPTSLSQRATHLWRILLLCLCLIQIGTGQEFIGPHGFLTLEAEISNRDSVGRRGTFDLHHFNIFGNYLINSKARVFGEIEWEHGADLEPGENNKPAAGFVRLERAWFEYRFSNYVTLRLGKFLTPYGIYNEIHDAAPAYDTSILPESLYGKHPNNSFGGERQRFYAKFSIGVQLLGTLERKDAQLQYQLFLVNGRGKNPFEQDDNSDKGIGLRLLGEFQRVKVGYSLYTDRNGLFRNTRQTSHAVDLRLEFNHWRLNSEFAHTRLGSGSTSLPTQVANGGYVEFAYYLFSKQTVLIRYDVIDPDNRFGGDFQRDIVIGTSVQFIKDALVKGEVHFWHQEDAPRKDFVLAIASLAVVF